jgi:L-aspartate oxidase
VGQVYLHTTNPDIATGDGVAMAFRAGIPVANMEFVQFHPTSFYTPEGRTFLISEAVRGEGAVLRKITGETFMEQYHEMGCLAPRDVVARAIDREMKMSGHTHVLLDCTHLDGDFMVKRFPNIYEDCLSRGIDLRKQPIPVVPAAHYACGGVVTGLNGETRMKGLFATGEVSHTGVHGANRLASNSLLEALIFSHRAALYIRANRDVYRVNPDWPSPPPPKVRPINASFERVRISHCRDEIRRLMWDYVGIVRSTERLELAKQRLSTLRREIEDYVGRGYLGAELLEVWNMVEIADIIVTSALQRKESRGLHYNIDYPETHDDMKFDTVILKEQ